MWSSCSGSVLRKCATHATGIKRSKILSPFFKVRQSYIIVRVKQRTGTEKDILEALDDSNLFLALPHEPIPKALKAWSSGIYVVRVYLTRKMSVVSISLLVQQPALLRRWGAWSAASPAARSASRVLDSDSPFFVHGARDTVALAEVSHGGQKDVSEIAGSAGSRW